MNRKIIKITKTGILLILLMLIISLVFPTWTPQIEGDHSISTLKQIQINGTDHAVMIRGLDQRNPIIVFVHGGPGSSEIPYVRKYQDLLEENFTIVHYDQRGSGKSYHFFEDYANLSADLLVDDLLALTDYLKSEFRQEKILLIGHSYGTYIGMKAVAKAPEQFIAYIGIGQVSNHVQSELDSLNYAIEQAEQASNSKDAQQLEQLRDAIAQGKQLTPRNMVRKYGGAARLIDDNQDYVTGFLFNPEYNVLDVIRYARGIAVSQDVLLKEEFEHDITSIVGQVDIPVYFVMGQYDYMTSTRAAKAYFDELQAPAKSFVIFENSAHYPQFEEEARFAAWLNETWRQIAD